MGPGRLESCWSCRRPVFLAERLVAGGKLRHRTCFTCVRCGHQLNLVGCYETENGDFVCETCPDEEKEQGMDVTDKPSAKGDDAATVSATNQPDDPKDEYSLNFEVALEKSSGDARDIVSVVVDDGNVNKCDDDGNQPNTASDVKEWNDDVRAEVTAVIDQIISDAIERVRVREKENEVSEVKEDVKVAEDVEEEVKVAEDVQEIKVAEDVEEVNVADDVKIDVKKEDSPTKDYPEDLNPFADEEEETPSPPPRKPPPKPATRQKRPVLNKNGQKIIEAPVVNLNPFWSEGEPSSEEETNKPTPAPRQTLQTPEPSPSPFIRSKYGSNTSLSSMGSSISISRRKKGPAPQPPVLRSPPSPCSSASSPSGYGSRSPVTKTKQQHRKSRPAPPPPVFDSPTNTLLNEKKGKDYENKIRQNLSMPDKSTYGKWKRKKGQAPGLPIPQRRRITPLPLPDLYRELEDLEIQQRELERQGVSIEQTIRQYESENVNAEVNEEKGKDVEGLILQLFEIVNQKNELFRKQAELMYL